ncbi:MAG: dockerin type I domain-containing protein [Planctomycetota bacterium]|nr:dockerin type I domain-containing protein [Planctomycetota bacterium]
MTTQTRWATVATASTLICAGSAMGDLLNLDYEIVGVNHITGANAPTGDHFTVDIFAVVEAGDRLDAVAGDDNVDKIISALPTGSFWQNAFGGNDSTAINPLLFGTFPSLEYDSFVTIGLLDQTGNAMSTQGIDFSQFEVGGDIFADNGAWYVTPADAQGESEAFSGTDCSSGFAVRVARLTVNGLGTTIHLEGIFQGKDSAGTTWSSNGSVDIGYVPIDDCNNNGVADNCDIANGDSDDSNENGIPDECETFDCNGNGIDDADDIADGTSSDCNGNAIPDECDIADGTSSDCDGNGTPDECQSNDCNGNGVPDNCDVADGTSEDCDGDGTPDECEPDSDGDGIIDDCEVPPNYVNLNTGDVYEFFDNAIADANQGDSILGLADAVSSEASLNFDYNCVEFIANGDVYTTAPIDLAPCGTFNIEGTGYIDGNVRTAAFGTSRIEADSFLEFDAIGMVIVRTDSTLEVSATYGSDFEGTTIIRNRGVLSGYASAGSGIDNQGTMHMMEGASLESDGAINTGTLNAQGTIIGDLSNGSLANAVNDLMHIGDLTNDGMVNIFTGVYYLTGTLTNNGTINGDIDEGPGLLGGDETQPGDGFNVAGSYNAGPDASLTMPHEYWAVRIGGHVNLEINDPGNFHMSLAELHATGRVDGVQDIEVMGTDLGNTEDGLEQGAAGNFPLGTLRIDASSSARLVDVHDNDSLGQDAGEAFYCDTLVVDGYLDTNGYKVYANNVVINGKVSDDDDVIIIDPPVLGDLTGDGLVDVLDLLVVIADWGSCPGECSAADLNGDGVVDVLDLLIILQEWS